MTKIKHRVRWCVLFFFLAVSIGATPPRKQSGKGVRLHLGPLLGFYSVNPNHAINPSPKMSLMAGFKKEFRVDRNHQVFFLIGIDYLFHGLGFRSYYFKPDSVQLYDKSFAYDYTVFVHELDLPLQFKYLFNREDNSLFSPYVVLAYNLRYLGPSRVTVSQNGTKVIEDSPDLKFRTPLLYKNLNAGLSIGVGWQRNNISDKGSSFFAELSARYGFSSYYFTADYAPSALYINGTHLCLQVGLKF